MKSVKSKPCYNCRRRRLRCDRSRPTCRKCWTSGEECLGYGTVLRWANAPAVRGKLVGELVVNTASLNLSKTVKEPSPAPTSVIVTKGTEDRNQGCFFINPSLLDPLVVNGFTRKQRRYLHHCMYQSYTVMMVNQKHS